MNLNELTPKKAARGITTWNPPRCERYRSSRLSSDSSAGNTSHASSVQPVDKLFVLSVNGTCTPHSSV